LSKIDLKAAFNLLRVVPGHKWKTAFWKPEGLFEYNIMPFGLANAPATFQRFIQHFLQQYLDVCCFVYIDDILIFSKTRDAHLRDLNKVLAKLKEHSSKASLTKCKFFASKVTFLGFDITQEGLKMNGKKLNTIADWPFPSNLKGLQRFLGYTNFYGKFIPRFLEVAEPLTTLTQEDKQDLIRGCPEEAVKLFEKLKWLFTQDPLLLHFDFDKDRVLHVDSSGYAIIGVLSQPNANGDLLPVSYFSRKLTEWQRSWQVFDLELLAIVAAFEEWRAWLMGTKLPVKVYSDHSNLIYFKTAKYLSPKQVRWVAFLDMLNMLIFHIAGSKNPTDAPSRQEDFVGTQQRKKDTSAIVEKLAVSEMQQLCDGTHDLYFQRPSTDMLSYLKSSYTSDDYEEKGVTKKNDTLWHQGRLFVPHRLRLQIVKMYHDAPTVGHPGVARSLSIIFRTSSWTNIRQTVFDYVKTCSSCQRVEAKRSLKTGKLISLYIEN
jgi:hypothetical protein